MLHWIADTNLYSVTYGCNIGDGCIRIVLAGFRGLVQGLSACSIACDDIGHTSCFEPSGKANDGFLSIQGNGKNWRSDDKQERQDDFQAIQWQHDFNLNWRKKGCKWGLFVNGQASPHLIFYDHEREPKKGME